MTTVPGPGWYPDPQTTEQMRWWDGTRWTDDTFERVEPVGGYLAAPGQEQRDGQAQQAGRPGAYGQPGPAGRTAAPTTPDGVRLATWGRRVGARVVDGVVVVTVGLLLALPFVTGFVRHLRDVTEQQAASGTFDPFAVYDGVAVRDLVTISVVGLVVNAVYEIGFLLWRQATPGKLLLGLRVRLLDDATLPARSAVLRWATYVLPGQVPSVGPIWTIADSLWPLWDARRQALHDKVAGSCVVHPEPTAPQAQAHVQP